VSSDRASLLRNEILRLTSEYAELKHARFLPGDQRPVDASPTDGVPYAGRVFDQREVVAAVASTLDFWLTLGAEGDAMEKELAALLGVRSALLVNSGSSANLIALSALTSFKLPEERRIRPGDEVVTVASGFPTTVAPVVQSAAIPVFIDADPQTLNARVDQLEEAHAAGKTKAVFMAHALGNPFDIGRVVAFCKKHDLSLIEDNCDALGAEYAMPLDLAEELDLQHLIRAARLAQTPRIRLVDDAQLGQKLLVAPTGTFGDLSTQSFYPPHHITMGEGGAVNIVRKPVLRTIAESFRDWGRDCWCPSGKDNTCGKRFQWQMGELPEGYDHKYVYSHLGFNLKPLDIQAAIGRVQLTRIAEFVEARKRNWEYLRRGLHGLEGILEFSLPTHATRWVPPRTSDEPLVSTFEWDATNCRSEPSWFGFAITVAEEAPFSRTDLARHLDREGIGNRMLFGGNLVRQPAFVQLKADNPRAFRHSTTLAGADRIMNDTLFVGTYPGLSFAELERVCMTIRRFVGVHA
jgi:CDP-6-deoxy-D-xylo-4-hexulose-3-dehydrase